MHRHAAPPAAPPINANDNDDDDDDEFDGDDDDDDDNDIDIVGDVSILIVDEVSVVLMIVEFFDVDNVVTVVAVVSIGGKVIFVHGGRVKLTTSRTLKTNKQNNQKKTTTKKNKNKNNQIKSNQIKKQKKQQKKTNTKQTQKQKQKNNTL